MDSKGQEQGNAIMHTIIDVRTEQEFAGGHVEGSLNIPIGELYNRTDEIKNLPQPVILCCASGIRSAAAAMELRRHGIDCVNAGSWITLHLKLNHN